MAGSVHLSRQGSYVNGEDERECVALIYRLCKINFKSVSNGNCLSSIAKVSYENLLFYAKTRKINNVNFVLLKINKFSTIHFSRLKYRFNLGTPFGENFKGD